MGEEKAPMHGSILGSLDGLALALADFGSSVGVTAEKLAEALKDFADAGLYALPETVNEVATTGRGMIETTSFRDDGVRFTAYGVEVLMCPSVPPGQVYQIDGRFVMAPDAMDQLRRMLGGSRRVDGDKRSCSFGAAPAQTPATAPEPAGRRGIALDGVPA